MVNFEKTESWLSHNYTKVGEHLYVNPSVNLKIENTNNNGNVQIVFLMGGSGTRLLHVTKDQFSKHMIGVGDHPLSRYVFDLWRNSGFDNFAFLIDDSQKGDSIREHYGDGKNFGVKIKYSAESKKLGSGGALKLAIEKNVINKEFVNHFPDDEIVGYENFPR